MEEPTYHLAGVMHTRDELPADFDGPLSVILLLLSKNKIEIQDVTSRPFWSSIWPISTR